MNPWTLAWKLSLAVWMGTAALGGCGSADDDASPTATTTPTAQDDDATSDDEATPSPATDSPTPSPRPTSPTPPGTVTPVPPTPAPASPTPSRATPAPPSPTPGPWAPTPTPPATPVPDRDGDGFPVDIDCNDKEPEIHPGALEICDHLDNDCDGEVDEGLTRTYCVDADGDGVGDPDSAQESCTAPEGYSSICSDCDDSNPARFPGNDEVCDKLDNDCDGEVDEDLTVTWYQDGDQDGYGTGDVTAETCLDLSPGFVTLPGDCDDGDATVNPAASEQCDGVDNDCDGATDEDFDQDGDGALSSDLCPTGTDCDDTDPAVGPAADEVCDGVDNDCDGEVDDGVLQTWFMDYDDDGYGDDTRTVEGCTRPTVDYVAIGGDCNDLDAAVNPKEVEVCDREDNNCNGLYDEGFDQDADGYLTVTVCPFGTDCDDTDPAINPAAVETCDDVDNDCDGEVDEGLVHVWYADADNDGYGAPGPGVVACEAPEGYVLDDTDCDDGHAQVNPGEQEVWDGLDNDCDGVVDVSYCDRASFGGYGYLFCAGEIDWSSARLVCLINDMDLVSVGNEEENLWLDQTRFGFWGDRVAAWMGFTDQFLEGAWVWINREPVLYVNWAEDEPDNGAAGEDCAVLGAEQSTWIDLACGATARFICQELTGATPATTWYVDQDGDGYGSTDSVVTSDEQPEGYVSRNGDCDDTDPDVHPGAEETCNGVDEDCDGETDEGLTSLWYIDGDGDGVGSEDSVVEACSAPVGYTAGPGDCDDRDATVYPGADEVCDGQDNDCDELEDEIWACYDDYECPAALGDDCLGAVGAWGANRYGQLGDGSSESADQAVELVNLGPVRGIGAGGYHTLAVTPNGHVWAWGRNNAGQLGDGTTDASAVPVPVHGLTDILFVSGGAWHSLALGADGRVWAWGGNGDGQLGDGTFEDSRTPVRVRNLTGVKQIAAGGGNLALSFREGHSLALDFRGTVWAWGRNDHGQLGDDTLEDAPVPVQVHGLADVVAIAAGAYHSLAVTADGAVWAWGRNDNYQLGTGDTEDRTVPVQVPGLEDALSVAGGALHSLALLADGTLWQWGTYYYYDPDGSFRADVPEVASALPLATSIAAGYYWNAASAVDHTAWVWGNMDLGTGAKPDPVQVQGLRSVSVLAAGFEHGVALQAPPP